MRRASENYNGKGIENGIDVDNILRLLKIFKDNLEVSSQLKAALETIMAGASWSGCRINSFDSISIPAAKDVGGLSKTMCMSFGSVHAMPP